MAHSDRPASRTSRIGQAIHRRLSTLIPRKGNSFRGETQSDTHRPFLNASGRIRRGTRSSVDNTRHDRNRRPSLPNDLPRSSLGSATISQPTSLKSNMIPRYRPVNSSPGTSSGNPSSSPKHFTRDHQLSRTSSKSTNISSESPCSPSTAQCTTRKGTALVKPKPLLPGTNVRRLHEKLTEENSSPVTSSSDSQGVSPAPRPLSIDKANKKIVTGRKPPPLTNSPVTDESQSNERLDEDIDAFRKVENVEESDTDDSEEVVIVDTDAPVETTERDVSDDAIAMEYKKRAGETIEDESPFIYKFYDDGNASPKRGNHVPMSISSVTVDEIMIPQTRKPSATLRPSMMRNLMTKVEPCENSVRLSSTSNFPLLALAPLETYATNDSQADRVATAFERITKQLPCNPKDRFDASLMAPKEAFIPLFVASMWQHRMDPKVADTALTTLRRLSITEVFRKRIRKAGGIDIILEMMRYHSLRIRIQVQCCLTLANLSYQTPKNKEAIIRSGGLGTIIGAMKVHRRVEHIQAWGCLALRNLTSRKGPGGQITSVSLAAIDPITFALESFPNSEVVQQNGLLALTSISRSSRHGMRNIRTCGGLDIMIRCMQHNVAATRLSDLGLSCMRNLVEDEFIQKAMGENDGIECITVIMNHHREHVGITVKGCAVLRHLAFQYENRMQMGRTGSIRAIVNAMKDHKRSSSDSACFFLKALSNATFDSVANKMLAGRVGGIEETLDIIRYLTYRSQHPVIEDGCRVLRNLLDGVVANHRLMIKHKGMSIVLDAIRVHGTRCSGVAEHGIALFVNLSTSKNIAVQMTEKSGDIMALAHRFVMTHKGNESVAKQVGDLMRMLDIEEYEPLRGVRFGSHQRSADSERRSSRSSTDRVSRPIASNVRAQYPRSEPFSRQRKVQVAGPSRN